ncbi:putative endo-1,4-beta-xylanase [Leptodontidium sp. MPI-SDFR-AT-0119]|nr:putative endo-1,4-beta-xylanase [Leptodontidium sp. MPI-SDFR-AT-0119]
MHSLSLAAVTAALALFHEASSAPATNGIATNLNELAKQKGKLWFGTAADIPQTNENAEQTDKTYLSILTDPRIFGEMTPANIMKFEYTEPTQNVFNFTGGDYFINLAKSSGAKVRCHNLVWVDELSPFITSGTWTAATLTAVMENHIKTTIKHFGSSCYSWDVINEALLGNGSFSSSIWYDTIGPDYFYLAFKFAAEAVRSTGKDIKLYYNDYGIESPGPKVDALLDLIKHLQHRHIRFDGVGMESHFEVGSTPSTADQLAVMKSFLAMGVEVAQTELDVRFTGPPFYTATREKQQARDYYSSVAACMQAGKGCIGTTVWDFTDRYSWVPGAFKGQGGADIYNETFVRKPAYYAISEAIQGKPCTVC